MRPNTLATLLGLLMLVTGFAASGAERKAVKTKWVGTIKVAGKPNDTELQKLAKVTREDAENTALAAVRAKDEEKRITEGGLEIEHGYLVYSFEIKVKGKKGVQELIIDAGTGKVLDHERESDAAEKREKEGKGKKEGRENNEDKGRKEAREKKSEAKEKAKKESK